MPQGMLGITAAAASMSQDAPASQKAPLQPSQGSSTNSNTVSSPNSILFRPGGKRQVRYQLSYIHQLQLNHLPESVIALCVPDTRLDSFLIQLCCSLCVAANRRDTVHTFLQSIVLTRVRCCGRGLLLNRKHPLVIVW